MKTDRRSFFGMIAAFFAAPALAKVESIAPAIPPAMQLPSVKEAVALLEKFLREAWEQIDQEDLFVVERIVTPLMRFTLDYDGDIPNRKPVTTYPYEYNVGVSPNITHRIRYVEKTEPWATDVWGPLYSMKDEYDILIDYRLRKTKLNPDGLCPAAAASAKLAIWHNGKMTIDVFDGLSMYRVSYRDKVHTTIIDVHDQVRDEETQEVTAIIEMAVNKPKVQ